MKNDPILAVRSTVSDELQPHTPRGAASSSEKP